MIVVKKNPAPIYEVVCPECKSVIRYKACEVAWQHIDCPVCESSIWANTVCPVNFDEIHTDGAPAADAREVKHGKWICMSDADGYYYCCSVCGESLERISTSPCTVESPYPDLVSCSKTRFCPSCGVVMDE